MLQIINDEEFEDVVKTSSEKPVIVDFFAEWCGPCKMLSPILEEYAKNNPNIRIVKVDADKSQLPVKFGVRGIPTLLLFKDGEVQGTKVGAINKSSLQAWVEDLV